MGVVVKGLVLKAFAIAAFGLFSLQASAATVSFGLNVEFSGGSSPSGPTDWMTLTFEDVAADTVRLTIDNGGLTSPEFVSDVYFNVDNGIDATSLTFDYVSGEAYWKLHDDNPSESTAQLKADGDGFFDVRFEFKTSNNQRFEAGATSVYDISGTGLDALDFLFLSEPGGGNGSYYAAAHVQGIGPSDGSGWIGAPVPVPAAVWLFGSGLLGLVGIARRKRA